MPYLRPGTRVYVQAQKLEWDTLAAGHTPGLWHVLELRGSEGKGVCAERMLNGHYVQASFASTGPCQSSPCVARLIGGDQVKAALTRAPYLGIIITCFIH